MFKFQAVERTLHATGIELLVAGTVKDYTAAFLFDDSWDGWSRKAVFCHPKSCTTKEQLLDENGECLIPWEVLTQAGILLVGVYGTMGDKTRPTIWADRLYIQDGTKPGETAKEPTPEVIDQLQQMIDASVITGAEVDEDGNLIISTRGGTSYNAGQIPSAEKEDEEEENKNEISIIDRTTGKTYILYVDNGKLTMAESEV